MLASITKLAALAALWPLSQGLTVSEDYHLSKRANELQSLVGDSDVLDAFKVAGHPDAVPSQTWHDDHGEMYQALWVFDQGDWDAMHSDLLTRATGRNSSKVLLPRQFTNDGHLFFCDGDTNAPFAWTYSVSAVTGVVCGGFFWGAGYLGKVQVIQRYNLQDVGGHKLQTTFKYIWYFTSFASGQSCTAAMQYGLTNACAGQIKAGHKAIRGETTWYTAPKNFETHKAIAGIHWRRQ